MSIFAAEAAVLFESAGGAVSIITRGESASAKQCATKHSYRGRLESRKCQ